MDLGSIEYNDPANRGLRATSLVLAFREVAIRVVDKSGSFFAGEEAHYEASPNETSIVVGGAAYIGQAGGNSTKEITVPLGYDTVKRLLAEGVNKGETVDLTDENLLLLQAAPNKSPAGGKLSL